MFNKHLFKILAMFVMILGFGLLGYTMINNYQENQKVQATAGQTK